MQQDTKVSSLGKNSSYNFFMNIRAQKRLNRPIGKHKPSSRRKKKSYLKKNDDHLSNNNNNI